MGLFVIFPPLSSSVFAFEHLILVEIMGPGDGPQWFFGQFFVIFLSIFGQFLVIFWSIFDWFFERFFGWFFCAILGYNFLGWCFGHYKTLWGNFLGWFFGHFELIFLGWLVKLFTYFNQIIADLGGKND